MISRESIKLNELKLNWCFKYPLSLRSQLVSKRDTTSRNYSQEISRSRGLLKFRTKTIYISAHETHPHFNKLDRFSIVIFATASSPSIIIHRRFTNLLSKNKQSIYNIYHSSCCYRRFLWSYRLIPLHDSHQ